METKPLPLFAVGFRLGLFGLDVSLDGCGEVGQLCPQLLHSHLRDIVNATGTEPVKALVLVGDDVEEVGFDFADRHDSDPFLWRNCLINKEPPSQRLEGIVLLDEIAQGRAHLVTALASVDESVGSGLAGAHDEVAVVVNDDTFQTTGLAVAVPDVVLIALLVLLPVAEGVEGWPSTNETREWSRHDSDPFKIDKSRYTQGCPVVCNHPPAPTWDRTE